MPCIDVINGLFEASRSAILSEITDMISSACKTVLSSDHLKLSFIDTVVMSSFALNTLEESTSTNLSRNVRLSSVLLDDAIISWTRRGIAKLIEVKVQRIHEISEGRNG